jgi:hypothetical protein
LNNKGVGISSRVSTLIVLTALVLAGCGGAVNRPPLVYLVTNEGLVDGFQSSYCWDRGAGGRLCVDSNEPYFESPTLLPAKDPIQIQFDTPLPDEVVLSISKQIFGETIYAESLPASELIAWSPAVPPGDYVLDVHVTWKQGEVSYWFSVALE